jgi:putative glutamine amidotransferase
MSKPLVGVATYHLEPGRVTKWDTGAYGIPDSYVDALRRAGAGVVLLPGSDGDSTDLLHQLDGLLLAGGGDVEPSRYGADPHPALYGVDKERDQFEIGIVLRADRERTPTFAICRGAQVVNVAFGGTLYQHLPDHDHVGAHGTPKAGGGLLHDVKVSESSRLFSASGASVLRGSSSHHQGIDHLGDGLIPVAWAGDGLIEAVERPQGWLLAVQWHPEVTADSDPAQQSLFDAFVEQAGRRRAG